MATRSSTTQQKDYPREAPGGNSESLRKMVEKPIPVANIRNVLGDRIAKAIEESDLRKKEKVLPTAAADWAD